MRDRLIEIVDKAKEEYANDVTDHTETEYIVESLLDNGVVVPPCKVGDTVWMVYTPKYPANPEDKGKYFMCEDGVQRIIYGAKGLSIETWNIGTIPAKEIGKKLFFSEEEAEQKLKEGTKK